MLDDTTTSTMGVADNTVYFTREQFSTGLCLPVPSLVKQILHFTRAPPAHIYPNVFRILMGCSMLNFLYQLDIFLIKIYFIYTLKLGIGGRLSMSTHSPWLQFVTGLPESPKTKAKGVVLVKGLWCEMPSSPGHPYDLNQSLLFPGLFYLSGTCTPLGLLCFLYAPILWNFTCFEMTSFSKIFCR